VLPAAGPPAAPLLRAVAAGRPVVTFSQLYSNEGEDPFQRNYERVMQRFDADRDDAVTSAALFQQVMGLGGNVLQAYLCCGQSPVGPKVFCLHLPTRFVSALDGTPAPWNDLSFTFLGEVVQGLVSIVSFPEDVFDAVTEQVKTLNYMVQHQAELADLPVFPPVAAGCDKTLDLLGSDPNNERVKGQSNKLLLTGC